MPPVHSQSEKETSIPTGISLGVTNSQDEEQHPPKPFCCPPQPKLVLKLQREASQRILKALEGLRASTHLRDPSGTSRVGRALLTSITATSTGISQGKDSSPATLLPQKRSVRAGTGLGHRGDPRNHPDLAPAQNPVDVVLPR